MKHDFENARRGAVIESTGKTRVTMYLDDEVIEYFRDRATKNGRGYQTEINAELRNAMVVPKSIAKVTQGRSEATDKIMAGLECRLAEISKTVHRVEKSVVFVQSCVVKGRSAGEVIRAKGGGKCLEHSESGVKTLPGRRVSATKRPHKTA